MKILTKAVLYTASMISLSSFANVALPDIFNSHMVLQRECKIPIWGTASADEKVLVRFNGQEQATQADNSGKWEVELFPMQAGGPFKMEIKGNNSITLDDVLIGEVWLCSGQSNMEWQLAKANDAKTEIANAKYPEIRLFHIKKTWNTTPQTKLILHSMWQVCTPQNVPQFSAVGYFFGRTLNKDLNVPIGLINSSWSGTRIEPWTPPVGFASVPKLNYITKALALKNPGTPENIQLIQQNINNYKAWIVKAEAAIKSKSVINPPAIYPPQLIPYRNHNSPTVLYNAMINPIVPYAIRGVIWYQGESNRGDRKIYAEKMKALINGWRYVWNNEKMAFYFVQLAPFNYSEDPYALAEIWEAQTEIAQTVPETGMAVINDIGDLKNIHPTNKKDVGKRLALLALNKTYGKREIACDSPIFKEMKIENNAVKVTFHNGEGLKTRDGNAPNWFEICGVDGSFKKADAKIEDGTVVLTATGIDKPYAVRFAWHMLALPNLMNAAGLPASTFRAGKVPVVTEMDCKN